MSFAIKKKPLLIDTMHDLNLVYGELLNSVKRLTINPRNGSAPESTTYYTLYGEKIDDSGLIKLEIEAENHRASESKISDVDMASRMTYLVQKMVVAKSRMAVLAHANLIPHAVLRLLG